MMQQRRLRNFTNPELTKKIPETISISKDKIKLVNLFSVLVWFLCLMAYKALWVI